MMMCWAECASCRLPFPLNVTVPCSLDLYIAALRLARCPQCGTRKGVRVYSPGEQPPPSVLAEARRLHATGATHDCGEWRSRLLTPAGGFVSGVCLVCGGESAAPDQAENESTFESAFESASEGQAPKPDRRKSL